MRRKLEPISPTERAIYIIDETIKQLTKERAALAAQLPRRKPVKQQGKIFHPLTNEAIDYLDRGRKEKRS